MDNEKTKEDKLRKNAKEVLQSQINSIKYKSEDIDEVIYELRVHQIELEMQNEELREAQRKLEDSRRKYFDLYNFAPIGYITLDKNGIILEVNLTGAVLLGVERLNLQKSAFIQYIDSNYRNKFHNHIQKVLETENKQTTEIKLLKKDHNSFYTHFETININDENGNFKEFRITITDITTQKKAEAEKDSLLNMAQVERDKLTGIVNNISDEIWFADTNKKFTLANSSALQEFNINSEDDIKVEELVKNMEVYRSDGSPRPLDEAPPLRALNGEMVRNLEEIVRTPTSNEFRYRQVNASPVKDGNGKIIGAVSVVHDITELKNIEKELKVTEQKYHRLYSSMNEGVAIHEIIYNTEKIPVDYIITDVNPTYENITGLKRGNVIGKKASELYGTGNPPYLEIYASVAENGEPTEFETHFKPMNKDFCISVISPEKGKFATVFEDITERKKAEEEIIIHRKLLNAINRLFQEYLTTDTVKEVVEKCLEVAEEMTESEFGFFGEINENGRLDDRAISPPAWDVCETPNSHELLKNMEIVSYWGRTIKEEKSQIVNDPDSDPDSRGLPEGHPPITSFLGVPIKEGKKIIGMIALANKKTGYNENDKKNIEALGVAFVEILMRKRAEIEIKENMKNLAESNKELEQFAYITSHDLREPLRMITSFLQLLERRYRDQLDQDANEFIGFAVDGAKRLDAMTNDLLQYSKITNEKREIKPVNFEYVLRHALENLKVQIEENNAVITHDPLPTIQGDEKLKVQLFQNLISNSIKYRSQEPPKIHISAKKEKNQYLFSFKDNGIGMSPEHLEQIFIIFKRLHTKENYEGTGIGLAIAQKIVHQQDGQIWVESEPNEGSTFYFTIPINVIN